MEAKKMKGNSESKGKKRAKMSIGLGGDIGGLVVLGGALAVAGLFAIFVVKRHKTRAFSYGKRPPKSCKYMPKKDQRDYGNEGLRCLLKTSPTNDRSSYRGHGDSSTMSDIVQEDEILSESDDGLERQKMVVLDYSEKEITALSDALCPVQDECGTLEGIPIGSDEEVEKEVYLVEKDLEEEGEVSVDVNEKSSMDFHANTVLPAEIVEDTMPELQTHETQRSVLKEAKTAVADNCTHFAGEIVFKNHGAEKSMIVNVQSGQSSKVRVWIVSMLIVAMLMLSLHQFTAKLCQSFFRSYLS